MTVRRCAPSLFLLVMSACASAPQGETDQAIEDSMAERRANQAAIQRDQDRFEKILLNLDKSMDKYVESIVTSGIERVDRRTTGLESYIRETVDKHYASLLHAADDASIPGNQAIAVAALGFSDRPESLSPMVNAVHSADPTVSNNAVFGLSMLRDPRTPPHLIARIVEDRQADERSRIMAAWCLFRLQERLTDPKPVYDKWLEILSQPELTDPWILITSLRGISRSRNPEHAPFAEKLVSHPTPKVREAAAACLGYLGNRESHTALLTRISPAETNPNVRLAARKALQALAGNIDRGYDVREWQRVFETQSGG